MFAKPPPNLSVDSPPRWRIQEKGFWEDHEHYLQLPLVLPLMGRCLPFNQVARVCKQNQVFSHHTGFYQKLEVCTGPWH